MTTLRTPRLILRPWRDADREPFAALNADPRVMRYFPSVLTREQSDVLIERICWHHEDHGFGLFAVEIPGELPFAGFVGLSRPRFEAHFTPCVEVGWRLAHACWGRGYATEAAQEVLRFGFEGRGLREIVSFTVPANAASRRVMEKLGMTRREDEDFDHPTLEAGHPLRRHVLYRLTAERWAARPHAQKHSQ
ncbi:Acetyltransferase [Anaerolineae bacterium]|nr:GNAT family N-acetyltransferase [Sandaracinaceae bacterium]CAG0955493.1 Acetyltransferase [Anaerolineae bacterium]